MRYALIDQNGNIVNLITWDGVTPYNPPQGLTLERVSVEDEERTEIGKKLPPGQSRRP